MALEGRISTPDGVLFRVIAGEAVVLNLNSESYFGLDEVGTRLWAALTESPSIEAAHRALLEEFEVDADVLRADLDAFVAKLMQAGLVAVEDD